MCAPVVACVADAPLPVMPPDLHVFAVAVARLVIGKPIFRKVGTVAVAADLLVCPVQHLGIMHPAAHNDELKSAGRRRGVVLCFWAL